MVGVGWSRAGAPQRGLCVLTVQVAREEISRRWGPGGPGVEGVRVSLEVGYGVAWNGRRRVCE